MMKRQYLILSLLLLAACRAEKLPQDRPLELVPVSLHLGVTPLEDGTPLSKADYEPDLDGGADWQEIRNVALMQFEWVDDNPDNVLQAQLVGQKQYFDHWSATGLEVGENFALVKSSRKNTILVLANIDKDDISFPVGTTLGSFLDGMNASLIPDLDGVWYTVGEDRYLRMSGSVEMDGVDFGAEVGSSSAPLLLARNCAKVIIKVKNEAPASENLVLKNVQLCNVNQQLYFATQLDAFAASDVYRPRTPNRFDAPIQDIPSDGTLTYYVPANMRGHNNSVSQYDKNRHAPLGATCFRIYGTYGPSNTAVCYTYYLGADLVNDFNLEPNKKYNYEITLTQKGDASYDSRIEDMAEQKLTVDANCYLLHPPKQEWQSRIFAFPVRRAAVFWNASGTNMGLYNAASYEETPFTLEETSPWTAKIVWNELYKDGVQVTDFLLTDSGMGFDPNNTNPPEGHQPWIRVKLDAGVTGNALVAVQYEGAIVWSWHLWVTDYDPEVDMTPVEHTYIYAVPGGSLHRYNGVIWNTGVYKDAFIMDRNLGAMAAIGEYESHGLYYEPGRKDPFRYMKFARSHATKNVIYGVRNPNVFVYNGVDNWTTMTLFSTIEKWHDPLLYRHGGDYCEVDKSIYDPCPPGWRLPEKGTYMDVATGSGAARHREWTLEHPGLKYYPEGFENEAATGTIYFPAAGQMWAHNGEDNRHWGIPSRGIQFFQAQSIGYFQVTEDVDLVEFRVDHTFPNTGTGTSARCVRMR